MSSVFAAKLADVIIAAKGLFEEEPTTQQVCVGPDYILIHPALGANLPKACLGA